MTFNNNKTTEGYARVTGYGPGGTLLSEVMKETPPMLVLIYVALLISAILRGNAIRVNSLLPYRMLLLLIGVCIGSLSYYSTTVLEFVGNIGLELHKTIQIVLPIIIFKTAFAIDAHAFVHSWGQIVILALPGTVLNAVIVGVIMTELISPESWTYVIGVLFGFVCSPVYPVEIVERLRRISQTKHLSILLEGEAIVANGICILSFRTLLQIINGVISDWYQVVLVFTQFLIGGVIYGLVLGKFASWCFNKVNSDPVNCFVLTLVTSYVGYFTALEVFQVSGAIACTILGIMLSSQKTCLTVEVESFLLNVWSTFAYIADTVLLLTVGILVSARVADGIGMRDIALVVVTYVVTFFSRFIVLLLLAPIISRIGYGLTFRTLIVAVWSGIRGPTSLFLAFIVYTDPLIPTNSGGNILFHVTCLVGITLFLNLITTPSLLKFTGLSETTLLKRVNMDTCMRHLGNTRNRTIATLKMDRFLADSNWPIANTATVLKHPHKFNLTESDEGDDDDAHYGFRITTCPDCRKEVFREPTSKEYKEMILEARIRILKARKITYARNFQSGLVSKEVVKILSQAAEIAMDTEDKLIELDGLHKYFQQKISAAFKISVGTLLRIKCRNNANHILYSPGKKMPRISRNGFT